MCLQIANRKNFDWTNYCSVTKHQKKKIIGIEKKKMDKIDRMIKNLKSND